MQLNVPSVTVTLPVGVPLDEVTEYWTVYGCPIWLGSGLMPPTVRMSDASICPVITRVAEAVRVREPPFPVMVNEYVPGPALPVEIVKFAPVGDAGMAL